MSHPSNQPRLEIQDLGKRYGEVQVFANVNLQVHAGEFVAIVGDSGVGKSTLLNCMAGLDRWDQGDVLLQGQSLGARDERSLSLMRRQHVGFVFQAFHVLPHLSVAQNVALPLMLLGRDDPARVQAMLHAVGLGDLGERLPQQLSGGQLQRVAIARALVHAPGLILADEPTGNLDPQTAAQVMALLLTQVQAQGSALVLVTHSQAATQHAHRTLKLHAHGLRDVQP